MRLTDAVLEKFKPSKPRILYPRFEFEKLAGVGSITPRYAKSHGR